MRIRLQEIALQVLLILVLPGITCATTWIVSNWVGHEADFTTAQAAHDGAAAGDTILVVGSPSSYGSLTSTKQLVWLGPGYRVTDNNGYTQASPFNAILGELNVNAGSEQTIICGFYFYNTQVILNTNHIVFFRNYILVTTVDLIPLRINQSNCIITSNYIAMTYYTSIDWSFRNIIIGANAGGTIIANNYIERYDLSPTTNSAILSSSPNISCYNNVIYGNIDIANGEFYNNIIRVDILLASFGSCYVHHNLSAGADLPNGYGNLENVDMNSVFIWAGSFDGQYRLAAGSPAIGAGENGVDCGMYGGPTPYIPSGIPGIPTISKFFAPNAASQESGLPVEIEIRSRN